MAKQVKPVVQEVADDSEGKRGRKPREAYPGLTDGQLSEVPTDFDDQKHSPLQKSNFVSEDLFWDWKAGILQKKADRYAGDAKEASHFAEYYREHGRLPKSKRSIGKALVKQLEAMASIRDEIGEVEGVDLDAFLEAAKAMADS